MKKEDKKWSFRRTIVLVICLIWGSISAQISFVMAEDLSINDAEEAIEDIYDADDPYYENEDGYYGEIFMDEDLTEEARLTEVEELTEINQEENVFYDGEEEVQGTEESFSDVESPSFEEWQVNELFGAADGDGGLPETVLIDIAEFGCEWQKEVKWTGQELTPTVKLVDDSGEELQESIDYILCYENNIETGDASIIVKGIGNYTGTKTLTFRIVDDFIDTYDFFYGSTVTYTGKARKPDVRVGWLTQGEDYTVTYKNNINVGTAEATITGIGRYGGSKKITFTIEPADIDVAMISYIEAVPYSGKEIRPKFTVEWKGKILEEGRDYTVSYKDNVEVGYAEAIASGKGNFTGSTYEYFSIVERDISELSFSWDEEVEWTGDFVCPKVTIRNEAGTVLKENKDYDVEYEDNMDPGTGYIVVSGTGNYEGWEYCPFTIARNINDVDVYIGDYEDVDDKLPAKVYTGSAIKQKITLYAYDIDFYYEGTYLIAGEDYTLSYKNNINAGTATVTIKGKGDYTGTRKITFTIKKRDLSVTTVKAIPAQIYTGSPVKPGVTVTWKDTTLKSGTDYTVTYKNNTKIGTATVTIVGKGNFKGTKTVSFTIGKDIKKLKFTAPKAQVWNGERIKPDVTITSGNKTLKRGVDYTLKYKNNVDVGTATVTVTGKGQYGGTKTVSFKIIPIAPKITALTSGKRGTFTIKWKQMKNSTKFQIQYSLRSDMDSSKTVTVAGSLSSKTITGLQKGKTYYVRMRRYRDISGVRYYSKWTAVKQIRP